MEQDRQTATKMAAQEQEKIDAVRQNALRSMQEQQEAFMCDMSDNSDSSSDSDSDSDSGSDSGDDIQAESSNSPEQSNHAPSEETTAPLCTICHEPPEPGKALLKLVTLTRVG